MVPEYRYQVKDSSVLLPYFKKYIVSHAIKLVPWFVPANIVTMISNCFLYGALILSFLHQPGQHYDFPLIAFGIFMYVLGDHLDGMQAKRTGTGSALGEFCDHYLYAFNNGIAYVIVMNLYGITNVYLVSFVFYISYMTHALSMYEEYRTKWLVFEKLGTLEGLFILLAVILTGYSPAGYALMHQPVWQGLNILELLFAFTTFSTIGTLIRSGLRTKKFSRKFVSY